MATAKLLFETLNQLSLEDFEEFKTLIQAETSLVPTSSGLKAANVQDVVELMTKTDGRECVEKINAVLMKMKRSDLVKRLSATDSGATGGTDEQNLLKERIEKLSSVLESLDDLSDYELNTFKDAMSRSQRGKLSKKQRRLKQITDPQEMGIFIVQTFGEESLAVTQDALEDIGRTDLAQASPHKDTSFRKMSMERNPSELIHKAATMAAVRELLLEVLVELKKEEFLEIVKRGRLDISPRLDFVSARAELVNEMINFGLQSLKRMKELLFKINRSDLAELFPETGEFSVKESVFLKPVAPKADVHRDLSEMLHRLNKKSLEKFKLFLPVTCFHWNLPQISEEHLGKAITAQKLVDLMMKELGQQSVEMAREVFMEMNVSAHGEKKSEEGISKSVEPKQEEIVEQDSSSWTKLDPEVKTADPDEAPTYSLQSEAGLFECSVSGLRWVCKEKVGFRYRFCSWDGHMERMESRGYRPAGPLMDISIINGKMMEVFLPHWICIDGIPKPLDKFAVLHMDDCGDTLEKVSEVSSSHVKLSDPSFSLKGMLIKSGFPLKIRCHILIYQTNKAFLTLHIYLIPRDPALLEEVKQTEKYEGCKRIRKPDLERSLKMNDDYFLTSDLDAAEVSPDTGIKLEHKKDPNFFEVGIENANRNFSLTLRPRRKDQAVWKCTIRKGDYQSSGQAQDFQCVDGNMSTVTVHKPATIISEKEMLLKLIKDLKQEEFKEFKFYLKNRGMRSGFAEIPASSVDEADIPDLVDLMMNTYTQKAMEVAKDIFGEINRNDLVEMFPCSS